MKISVLWGILIICFTTSLSAQETGNYSSQFLVRGYPSYFLIGPDGTVLEMGSSLKGEQLIPTLEKYLE